MIKAKLIYDLGYYAPYVERRYKKMNNDELYKMVFLVNNSKIEVSQLSHSEVLFAVNFIKKSINNINKDAVLYFANVFIRINDIKVYYINNYTNKKVNITDFVEINGEAK
jgi:hypothetical protein